jgi:hypothetical protein
MTFDSTVTLGNLLTVGTIALGFVGAIVSWAVWRAQTMARIEAIERDKVAVTDCLRSHGETVTTTFCREQHESTGKTLRSFETRLQTFVEETHIGLAVLNGNLKRMADKLPQNPHPLELDELPWRKSQHQKEVNGDVAE